ncbi:MAG: hypothetical protein Q9211_002605 [Gyalolechia sp. 1 TL-2023]
MADSIQGDGLIRAERARAPLVADPHQLDRARERFSDSPPSYKSHQSYDSTPSQSPNPPSEEQQRREKRKWLLIWARSESLPHEQFNAQRGEEQKRIDHVPVGSSAYRMAGDNVKNRWIEQGIWKDEWSSMPSGLWKHEEPLKLEPDDTETEPQPSIFSFGTQPEPKPRRPRSDEEAQRIAERQATRVRERGASRPFHQFIYQLSKERDRIQDEPGTREANTITAADINTRAYENIKSTWTKRLIWNRKWGILPGMSWKHEEPLDMDDPIPDQASPFWVDEAEESPNLTANGAGSRVLSPTAGHTVRSSRRKPSRGHGRARPLESTLLRPVHSPKISKAPKKRRPGRQQSPNTTELVSSNGPRFLPGPDVAEPVLEAAGTPRRRSKRLPPKGLGTTNDCAGIASADPPQEVSGSRPKRIVGGNPKPVATAEPQGISKKQNSRRTRRSRKDKT